MKHILKKMICAKGCSATLTALVIHFPLVNYAQNHNPDFSVSNLTIDSESYIIIGEDDEEASANRTTVDLKYREDTLPNTGTTTLEWTSGSDRVLGFDTETDTEGFTSFDDQGNAVASQTGAWKWKDDKQEEGADVENNQYGFDGRTIYLQGKTSASSGQTATLKSWYSKDSNQTEDFAFSKDFTLLKVDVENLREQIITDAFEVSNKVTDQYLDAQASPTGDPRTYRVKLSLDLGSSAKIRFDLYDEDGASVDRNETEEPENGELQITEKTENAETFYATDNFRFVTWDTDDGHAGNQTIKVKLGDTVRMTLVVDNDLAYFDLPVGLPPSESSTKAIRTVDTRFVKLDYAGGDVVTQASSSTLIERMDKVFAQGAVRFDNVAETEKAPVKNLISIKDRIDSGSVFINIPNANGGPNPDTIQVDVSANLEPIQVAELIATSINQHYDEIRAQTFYTYPNPIPDRGYEDESFKYAHVVIDVGNEVIYNLGIAGKIGVGPGDIFIPPSSLSSGDVVNLHDVALLGLNYGDADPNTMDIFITNSFTALNGPNFGFALTNINVSSSSPLFGSFFIILEASRNDSVKPFTAPHEAGHILLNSLHSSFPTDLMYGGSTSASDSIQATKRIFDDALTTLRSASNSASGMLQNK